jgi:hypothetical protein
MLTGDLTGTAPGSVTRWRQRIAGGLLAVGGGAVIVSYFLPWTYASWPSAECSSCMSETRAPADGFLNAFPPLGQVESWFFLAIWIAMLIGLPLALLVLGIRVLTRPQPVRLRWKVIVILASVIGFCSALLLAALMALHYVDSPPPLLHIEIGAYLAFLGPLAVLGAGSVMPSKRHMVVD